MTALANHLPNAIPVTVLRGHAPAKAAAVPLPAAADHCAGCAIRRHCLVSLIPAEHQPLLQPLIHHSRTLRRAAHVYRQHEAFRSLYVVRSGSFKAYRLSEEGEEQVVRDYLPGEVLGVDGCASDRHQFSVLSLETASVCELPFGRFVALMSSIPSLHQHLMRWMGRELDYNLRLLMMVNKHTAEQRLAAWLLQLSSRYAELNLSGRRFHMSMLRLDIGNLLGLTLETVSRNFAKLQRAGVVAVQGREVTLLDPEALRRMAGGARVGTDTPRPAMPA